MKTLIFFLITLLHSTHRAYPQEVPPDVKIELNKINELTKFSSSPLKGNDESVNYWNTLNSLGKLISEKEDRSWLESLKPLDRALAAVAVDHFEHPSRARTLSDWYGRFESEVSPEVRGHPVRRSSSSQGVYVESLHEEHRAPEYLRAWEAWILAPATREKTLLLRSLQGGLAGRGTRDTALLIRAYMDQEETHPTEGSGAFIGSILMDLRNTESLEGLLKLLERSEKTGHPFLTSISGQVLRDPLTRSTKIEQYFLVNFTGYNQNPRPGAPSPFSHHAGKLWLPALTEILKRPELKPRDRVLLTKAKDIIEKHCMGDAPK